MNGGLGRAAALIVTFGVAVPAGVTASGPTPRSTAEDAGIDRGTFDSPPAASGYAMKESWDTRIQRAERLAARSEAARELLTFYGTLLRAQKEGYEYLRGRKGWLPSGTLEEDLPFVRATMKGLLDAGLQLSEDLWHEATQEFDWAAGMDRYVIHQVSQVHTNAVCERLGMEHVGRTDRYYGVTVELFRARADARPRMDTDARR